MARGKNRRQHGTKQASGAASRLQPTFSARTLELVLARARQEQNPHVALEMFQAVLETGQNAAATAVSDGKARRMPDAKPYLEALFGAASSLRRLDRREEAVNYFREVLELDANDLHFARYWLAAALLDLQRHDELRPLLDRYDERTAVWRYAQALFAFRLGGDSDDARRLLEEACQLDAGFLDYLLGGDLVYAERPVRFGRDLQETTHSLAALFLPAWRSTPGAASWVRRVLRVPMGEQPADLPFPRRELRALPRRSVRWQVGLRQLDRDDTTSGEAPVWVLGIVNIDDQKMLAMTVIDRDPTPAALWRVVLSALRQPMEGKPHRPARLEVPRVDLCRAWQSMLAEVSVKCVFERNPQPISQMLDGLADLAEMQQLPSLPKDIDPGDFPQTDEVWQADLCRSPAMISNEEVGLERPWSVVVVDKRSGFVLSSELIRGEPTPDHVWENLVRTMAHPGPRDPMRPSVVELSDSDCYDFLKPKLSQCGVACVLRDELPELEEFCRALASSYGGPEICALADGPGVTREQMESFYQAAARYFEQAPWKHVHGEIPIEIRCAGLGAGTMYAIVLGRTGVTLGLALYNKWGDVTDTIRGLKGADEVTGLSVIYDEVTIMAPADLYLIERIGWPIPTPEAYPAVLRLEPGRQPQPPSHEDLDYLESCLRVIPDFVACDGKAKTYDIVTNGKRLKLRLSWTFPNH